MEWIDQLLDGFFRTIFIGSYGFLFAAFLLVIGIALYYLTGDNNPYKPKRKVVLVKKPKGKEALRLKDINTIEGEYKVVEVSREPIKDENTIS